MKSGRFENWKQKAYPRRYLAIVLFCKQGSKERNKRLLQLKGKRFESFFNSHQCALKRVNCRCSSARLGLCNS